MPCWGQCVCTHTSICTRVCVCTRALATAPCSKAVPSPSGRAGAADCRDAGSSHRVPVQGGGQAGAARQCQCLSLCGGGCVGAEGCGKHQNMCVPSALVAWRKSGGRLSPSLVPLAPQLRTLSCWPLNITWPLTLATVATGSSCGLGETASLWALAPPLIL